MRFRAARCFLGVALAIHAGVLIAAVPAAAKPKRDDEPPKTPSLESVDDRVKARAVLLVHAKTGEVFFSRSARERHPPASTTKLMTALLVYETVGLKGSFEVARSDQAEPSNVPLIPGETVRVRDLIRSVVMGSDNDSSKAVGRYAGNGSLERFIAMMNARARQLGCTRTNFKNPNGLPAEGQYTTCEDLLRIFQKFLQYPELREFGRTKGFTLKTKAGEQFVKNHNKLLGVYPGMDAAKTGWTYASRHTYAASLVRGEDELHLIILNSPNKWTDTRVLCDYAFGVLRDRKARGDRGVKVAAASRDTAAPPPKAVREEPAEPERMDALPPAPGKPVAQGDEDASASPETPAPGRTRAYVVQKGDSLFGLSQRFGCSVEEILAVNKDITDPAKIWPGQTIQIPASGSSTP